MSAQKRFRSPHYKKHTGTPKLYELGRQETLLSTGSVLGLTPEAKEIQSFLLEVLPLLQRTDSGWFGSQYFYHGFPSLLSIS